MDIDMSVLKLMESEREIPFDDLVSIIEHAILVAYESTWVWRITEVSASILTRHASVSSSTKKRGT